MFLDTQALTRIVERSFDLSMSGALTPELRAESLAQGKRLRELLMRALGARFDAASADFQRATTALNETNKALADAANDLEKVSKVVGRLGELAGYLDKALGVAGKVIA
jgi:hypothetical protein